MTRHTIQQQAIAGTLESSDVQILIDQNKAGGIDIDLSSSVEKQYGQQIRKVITDTLNHLGVTDAKLQIQDQGALDCTLVARTIAAVHRASDSVSNIDWEGLEKWNV